MFCQKFKKYLVVTLMGLLTLMLAGGIGLAKAKKELTPYEWSILSPDEKLKYKTIELRIQPGMDRFVPTWLNEAEISGEKNIGKRIQTGDLDTALAWYVNAYFMTTHPKVKLIPTEMPVCAEAEATKTFIAKLMAGEVPSSYRFGVGATRETYAGGGWAADITDLVNEWEETPYLKENPGIWGLWKKAWNNGRCYAFPGTILCARAVTYRRDWFEEAGIFDKEGKPAPPKDWTWMDLVTIAQKFENPKKNTWGFCDRKRAMFGNTARSFGIPNYNIVPDVTGKYTWRFNTTPQMLEFLQFVKDFKWKYKVHHELPGYSGARNKFKAGELAMAYGHWENEWFQELVSIPHLYREDMLSKDVVGMAPQPTGPQGTKVNTAWTNLWSFDPTLSKEELRAAWDWLHFTLDGGTLEINLQDCLRRYEAFGESALNNYFLGIALCRSPYHYEKERVPKKLADAFLSRVPQQNIKDFQNLISFPLEPQPYEFGLVIEPDMTHAFSNMVAKLLSDANADPKKVLEEYADTANRKTYSYKNKGDEEKVKAYAKAVDEYYKKYYPEYGNSEEWRSTFEKYYMVK